MSEETEDDGEILHATPEQQKAWAELAKQMGYYDFHRLDRCECGGICDCWTKQYTPAERKESGLEEIHFRSEWICEKCGAVEDKNYGPNMQELYR